MLTSENKLKVMVVDDTVVYRKILKDVLTEIDSVEVTGTAPNGDLAMRKINLDPPDLVLLDVEMPIMDGLQTLEEIKKKFPQIGVIMVSGVNERQAAITMEALSKGALDFVPKPTGNNIQANIDSLKQSLSPIISLFLTRKTLSGFKGTKPTRFVDPTASKASETKPEIKPVLPKTESRLVITSPTIKCEIPKKIDILVVGVSTGGPNALAKFIPLLPDNLDIPVLIVQHMPPMFTKSLASHLGSKSKIPVIEAENENIVEANKVYIAPGGKHMVINKIDSTNKISIIDTAPVNSCKPSVDVMFESIPSVYKGNILSVIMTGMGADGMNGVKKLKTTSCYCITQSEESCVVYGMPRAVDEAGLSDERIHLDNLAERVTSIIKNGIKKI